MKLKHRFIILMCVIVMAAIYSFTVAAQAQTMQEVDVFCKDSPQDNGSVPTIGDHWISPDIWVRNFPDGSTSHQNPIYEKINYIYVRVHNLGYLTANTTIVKVYWADPACGIQWPGGWNYIGQATITNLGDSSDAVIPPLPWKPLANAVGHRCLLVRLECLQDPIINEGNVKNDNNIAQKNVQIINLNPGQNSLPIDISFFLHNYPDANMDLQVQALETSPVKNNSKDENTRSIPFKVELRMPELSGFRETSFKYQKNNGSFLKGLPGKVNIFRLQGKNGKISGIEFKDSKMLNQIRITPTKPLKRGTTYELTITQVVNNDIVGGLTYIISVAGENHNKLIK